ncbi:nucleotidyltransferase family protein [Thalassobacillus pellis]|uniref:nucleotidyltransferase family protein n=1 Tax=Thalassobacillus pellis TaxID=748008 RepID=UPI0019606197|nr:nucleotidyltransferase domain-containing protein [Thalassobacillus pellis]MBM7554489.1 putative nucleotidyltransferase [Thalassobacillus pellis]
MYGLLKRDLYYIQKAVDKFPEIEHVLLFGSRALGNHKNGSDVDLAIVGKEVSHRTILQLSEYLNDIYPLPYMFDLVHYNTISNENLKKHVDAYGKELSWNQANMIDNN